MSEISKCSMDWLIRHSDFALPQRTELFKSDIEYEVVVVDSTEAPMERPKKQIILERRETKNPSNFGKTEQICTSFSNG